MSRGLGDVYKRQGRDGKSYLFVTPADRGRLRGVERTVGHRLPWAEVPTDDEVRAALARHAGAWLAERVETPAEDHLAAVDAAVAAGRDLRALAAVLLGRLAPLEGFRMPPLEPRRARAHPRHERPAPRGGPARRERGGPMVALTLSVGRDDGARPHDVAGALTNEGGLTGADVGRIDILPRMSVAEVPEDRVQDVMDAMQRATLRGRRVQLRVADRWEFRGPSRAAARGR